MGPSLQLVQAEGDVIALTAPDPDGERSGRQPVLEPARLQIDEPIDRVDREVMLLKSELRAVVARRDEGRLMLPFACLCHDTPPCSQDLDDEYYNEVGTPQGCAGEARQNYLGANAN
jgi:hypothetical protein